MAATYAMCTLGTSWNCFLTYVITLVTRENGSSRDPYPPTTVSLLTNPRFDFRSARTTFISHLNPIYPTPTVKQQLRLSTGDREVTSGRMCACADASRAGRREVRAVAASASRGRRHRCWPPARRSGSPRVHRPCWRERRAEDAP